MGVVGENEEVAELVAEARTIIENAADATTGAFAASIRNGTVSDRKLALIHAMATALEAANKDAEANIEYGDRMHAQWKQAHNAAIPKVVSTVAELDALPLYSLIDDNKPGVPGFHLWRTTAGWKSIGGVVFPSADIPLPATVLYSPVVVGETTDAEPGSDPTPWLDPVTKGDGDDEVRWADVEPNSRFYYEWSPRAGYADFGGPASSSLVGE